MTMWTILLVGVGAAVGAPLRFLADSAVKARLETDFPWGTFAVNVVGSFVLGGLTAAAAVLPPEIALAAGTGFCGALTTYSTFGYELVALTERREARVAATYLTVSVVLGVLAAGAGWVVVRAVV